MTNEEAKKMLKAKLECLKHETSGTNYACNQHLCESCSLNYEQGNMGEQKEALDTAIKALEQTRWIPCSERLPEEPGIYLVSMYRLGYPQREVDGFVCGRWERFGNDVIAWCKIPEPYKAESEDRYGVSNDG